MSEGLQGLVQIVDIVISNIVNFLMVPLSLEIYGISGLDILGVGILIMLIVWILKLVRG